MENSSKQQYLVKNSVNIKNTLLYFSVLYYNYNICNYMQNNGMGGIEMVKKRVSVQIEGRSYALITSDDEKYVESVADEITKRIRKAAQSSKHLGHS